MIASSSQINVHNKKSQTNSNNDKISYKAFVDCEAIMLAKQALKFEEFWEALPETDY